MENLSSFLSENRFIEAITLDSLKITYTKTSDLRFFKVECDTLESPHIEGLHISGCEIPTLWNDLRSFQENLQEVRVLHIAFNKFESFDKLILDNTFLPKLEFLNISHNSTLTSLIIENTTALKELNTSFCSNLEKLELIGDFNLLEKLDVSFCSLKQISLSNSLRNLSYLNFSKNLIQEINFPENLLKLKYIFSPYNQIIEFKTNNQIPKLNILDLSNNKSLALLHILPSLTDGIIETINLNDTRIDKQQLIQLKNLKQLKKVTLKNTPFAEIFAEEVNIGWEVVRNLLLEDQISFPHIKILLLGNTNVGKSNLLHYWEHNQHDSESKSTHGIMYKEISNLFENITLHVWDFGGQEYFHATHKLFFSGGAINILLWSKVDILREDQEEDRCFELRYWLRTIEQLGHDLENSVRPETIIIENKIDNQSYLPTPINQLIYHEQFKTDCYYHSMALMPDGNYQNKPKRLTGLNELLMEIVDKKNVKRPITYHETYEKIQTLKSKGNAVIKTSELFEEKLTFMRKILEVFHNMGIVLYFHEINPDLVFIKPEYFLDFLYSKIIGNKDKYKISENEIRTILLESDFGKILTYNFLKKMLKSFDLIFTIDDEESTFFIPQFLPKKPIWLDFFESHHFTFPSILIESDSYLMNLVMLKIFNEYGKSVKKNRQEYLFWDNGIIIEKELNEKKCILLIRYDRRNQRIELYEDNLNFELQKEIVEFIEKIPKTEQISKNQEEVFNIRFTIDGENYVSRKDLISQKNTNNNFVKSYKKNEHENFSQIISIYKFNKFLPEKNKGEMKKLMISYSKKDLFFIEEFKKYLEPLVRDGHIDEPWYCTLLEGGQDWNNEIQNKIKNWCDIVCFICSSNSFSSDYIKEKEIKTAIDRYDKHKNLMIVPIILEPFRWQSSNEKNEKYNLGRFTALPYTAKPVTDFKQRNIAWYIISECLRVAILNNLKPDSDDYWINYSPKENNQRAKLPKNVIEYFVRITNDSLNI